jgi:hypothetical protein
MGRSYQIDIMSALGDKLLVNFLQAFNGNFFAKAFATNIVVLAENAMQVATTKEDGTTTFGPANAGFFPHMQACSCHDGEHATATAAKVFIRGSVFHKFRSIYATTVRANVTVCQSNHLLENLLNSL